MKRMTLIAALGVLQASAAFAAAPPVKPNPEAVEAASMAFLGPEPYRTQNLARSRQQLEVGALRAPREERTANVLLSRGLTGVGIQLLLTPRQLDLISFEAKVPLPGPPNHMMTIWLGSQALMYRGDSLEDLVDRAIGHERFRFLQMAQKLGKAAEVQGTVAEYRAVALSPEFAVYRVEVAGTREALFSLMRERAVLAVVVNEDASAVAAFRKQKAEMESWVISRGPSIRMGVIDPDKPIPELPSFPSVPGEIAGPVSTATSADPR